MDLVQSAYREELATFRVASAQGDHLAAWRALERGHILAQARLPLHLHSHAVMLAYALARREWGEVSGQVFRLLLAPLGTLTGRLPVGNTGRTNVSAFASMPLPEDIADLLNGER
ncbi:hypothetical protein NSE01_38620 [Novosphingobium sediminis]|jgi:hypothetical protein|uniref:DUF3703 domain-containing protein n=1 Tax=Novosphingobium sediminis TaxID=707214 RepID=A0A512AQR7_9SPHN|nr:DUF3703 domain-containing protein [Novosphingobium sediminis]GEO02030.1 hypothetical protein NSE01_38620 [Novosphingobium sediminis]